MSETQYERPPTSELEKAIEEHLKSGIPIIQAWRDRNYSESEQRKLVARREKEIKERLEKIQAGIDGLKDLGFDPDHVIVEFDYSRIAQNHAFLDQKQGFFQKQIVRRRTTLSELPGIIAECDEDFRHHSIWPDGVIPFKFARLFLSPPVTEQIKEKIWQREVKTRGEWKKFLEEFFKAIDVFIKVYGSTNDIYAEFDWQEIRQVGQKKEGKLRLTNYSEKSLSLQEYFKDEGLWTGEAISDLAVLRVIKVSSPNPAPVTTFGVDVDIANQVASSDVNYFKDSFEKEMMGDKVTVRALDFARAAYGAMTPADAREYIKKYFAGCFEFYPELNQKLDSVLPDTEADVSGKMKAILEKLFEGIVF